ncbi:MAG: BlaI/MecI/CopY family transcriptional regulator [Oscillospiraceae bacterium]|nr:BlaI/MecI/CopY family transcriptional regulator [Oscillospiraceae bacterium]
MEEYKLFDAEYRLLSLIWENEPINSTQLSKLCLEKLGWKKPTTYNLIRKLSERGFLKNENATVTALVKKEQVAKYEGEMVVEKNFGGSLPAFISAFLDGKTISAEEADEVKRMIDKARRKNNHD